MILTSPQHRQEMRVALLVPVKIPFRQPTMYFLTSLSSLEYNNGGPRKTTTLTVENSSTMRPPARIKPTW
jgi:hypothetical protein